VHLGTQRERFFAADAFNRYYRDSVAPEDLASVRTALYHAVFDVERASHADALARANAVMSQAAVTQVSGALAKYARVSVKQGICHHLANDGELQWRKR
jgi:hypothetical protein